MLFPWYGSRRVRPRSHSAAVGAHGTNLIPRRGSSHDTARLAVNPFCHLERQVTTSSCHRLARPTVVESDYPLPCRSLECFASAKTPSKTVFQIATSPRADGPATLQPSRSLTKQQMILGKDMEMSRPTEGGPNEKAPTTFSLGRPLPLLQFFNLTGQIAPLSGKLPKQHSHVGIPCRKRLIIALILSLQKPLHTFGMRTRYFVSSCANRLRDRASSEVIKSRLRRCIRAPRPKQIQLHRRSIKPWLKQPTLTQHTSTSSSIP
jgi:hypothetical protein